MDGGVRVTFLRKNANSLQKDTDVLENVLEELTERQGLLLKRMIETGQWNVLENVLENILETTSTLATFFGVSERTIRRDLDTLKSRSIIRHDGPDKGGRWIILVKKSKII